jgi:hypothetical protein
LTNQAFQRQAAPGANLDMTSGPPTNKHCSLEKTHEQTPNDKNRHSRFFLIFGDFVLFDFALTGGSWLQNADRSVE